MTFCRVAGCGGDDQRTRGHLSGMQEGVLVVPDGHVICFGNLLLNLAERCTPAREGVGCIDSPASLGGRCAT
jgi:hypothetical protein